MERFESVWIIIVLIIAILSVIFYVPASIYGMATGIITPRPVQYVGPSGSLCGDANDDGRVNVLDVLVVQRYLRHLIEFSATFPRCVDVTGNGLIESDDATLINRIAYGLDYGRCLYPCGGKVPTVRTIRLSSTVCGDLNDDGNVNVNDVSIGTQFLSGLVDWERAPSYDCADVTGDRNFNQRDVELLSQMSIGKVGGNCVGTCGTLRSLPRLTDLYWHVEPSPTVPSTYSFYIYADTNTMSVVPLDDRFYFPVDFEYTIYNYCFINARTGLPDRLEASSGFYFACSFSGCQGIPFDRVDADTYKLLVSDDVIPCVPIYGQSVFSVSSPIRSMHNYIQENDQVTWSGPGLP